METTIEGPNSVLGKCFAVLEAVEASSASEPVPLAALARISNVPKASAYRIANDLVQKRMLERIGNRYVMGLRAFELASCVPSTKRLREIASPYIADLHATTRETVQFAVLAGTEVLYLEKIAGTNSARTPTAPGARMPLHCTGLGKAMLAFSPADTIRTILESPLQRKTPYTLVTPKLLVEELKSTRDHHIAYERDEAVLGLSCLASPVLGKPRYPLGAISVTVPTVRFEPSALERSVRRAAQELSSALRQAA